MAIYAIITNGVVSNCLDSSDPNFITEFPGAIRVDQLNPVPGIGYTYANGTFTAPAPPTPPAQSNPVFTKVGYMNLFTSSELAACFDFENSTTLNPTQKSQVRVFFRYFDATDTVDMTLTPTQQGLQMLEAFGLIGTGRAAQILASRN